MRNAFAREVTRLAGESERVVLLSGDIGNRLFDDFKRLAPTRFFNCGVAEANMMSVAAGMAMTGLRPVVYTITPFTTTRCFEQIRDDVCYHEAPVVIVGTGSGLSYADLGPTHHSLEDMAILRTLPGMSVIAPCDAVELRLALSAALAGPGPAYIRIGKKGEPLVHVNVPDFNLGKAIVLRSGTDVGIVAAGTILPAAMAAAEILAQRGLSCEVASMHTVKPLDEVYLGGLHVRVGLMATVEEHGLVGGLGGAVAEWRARAGVSTPQLAFGTPDRFMHEVGSQEYARAKFGLAPEAIADAVAARLGRG